MVSSLHIYFIEVEIVKKIMDKLFNVDKKTLIFLVIISFIGLLTGSIFMTVLDSSDKLLVSDTLGNFLSNVEPSNYVNTFIESLLLNVISVIFIWILGISIVGFPIAIIFVFIKSFLLSFSLASFIANFKFKGLLLGVIYNFPHNFISLVLFIYLGVYSIRLSIIILNCVIKRKSIDFKSIMNRYLLVLISSLVLVIILSLIETFLMPYLLKIINNML